MLIPSVSQSLDSISTAVIERLGSKLLDWRSSLKSLKCSECCSGTRIESVFSDTTSGCVAVPRPTRMIIRLKVIPCGGGLRWGTCISKKGIMRCGREDSQWSAPTICSKSFNLAFQDSDTWNRSTYAIRNQITCVVGHDVCDQHDQRRACVH